MKPRNPYEKVEEIGINISNLEEEIKKLYSISAEVSNKKIGSKIDNSKGVTADEVNNFINSINNLSSELGKFMSKNAELLENGKDTFVNTDEFIANTILK